MLHTLHLDDEHNDDVTRMSHEQGLLKSSTLVIKLFDNIKYCEIRAWPSSILFYAFHYVCLLTL